MAQTRATFAEATPERVLEVLAGVLAERGYDVTRPGQWSLDAAKGSVGRNIMLGGFAQRMDFHFDLFLDPVSGVIVDAGVREQASALMMGGAVGAVRTTNELSSIVAAVHAALDGEKPPGR